MEETNMTGNVAGNESLLIPLEGFQVQSFSCIAVSFENILHDFLFVHLFIFALTGSWEKCARCITYARMCLHVHACSRCCVIVQSSYVSEVFSMTKHVNGAQKYTEALFCGSVPFCCPAICWNDTTDTFWESSLPSERLVQMPLNQISDR